MSGNLKRFIAKIVGIGLGITFIGWLVFSFLIPQYYLPVFPYLLAFFVIVAILVHAYQIRLAKKDIAKFARMNMIVTFIKLIIYSIFAIVYIANDSENAWIFVVGLLLLYLVFSFLEVSEISRFAKNKEQ